MGCRMSLKLRILENHLYYYIMSFHSEKQGETFHQDMKEKKKRYESHYYEKMIGGYIWSIMGEFDLNNNRKSKKNPVIF